MRSLAAVWALLLCRTAFAEAVTADSIEWLTCSRASIAIVKTSTTDGGSSEAALVRALKGEPPRHAVFKQRLTPGSEYLAFFLADGAPVLHDLTMPLGQRGAALGMDLSVLDTRDKILGAVTARLRRREPCPPDRFVELEIPSDAPAYRVIFSESACFLRVPADQQVKQMLVQVIATSKDPNDRARATYSLSAFPGAETVALLRTLLADPSPEETQVLDSKTKKWVNVRTVRHAASVVLEQLRSPGSKPKR